jgi:AcrR family transcriptional regulator
MSTRGVRADGEATRVRILDAAGELFAARGFAETTNKAIAAQAGVDLASINYHFGSRAGLYQAVLIEAHRRLMDVADLRSLAQSRLPAADKLKALIGQLVRKATGDAEGWHLTVLAAEIFTPSSHIQVLFESEILPKASLVKEILGEITAIPADDPALTRCLLSVGAPCLSLLIGRRGIPGPLQDLAQQPPEVLVEHLHGFALGGLKAIGEAYRRRANGQS